MHLGIVDDDTRLFENPRFLLQSEPGVQSVHTFATEEFTTKYTKHTKNEPLTMQ